MKMRVAALAAAMLAGGNVHALSQVKNTWGEGRATCSAWTKERGAKTVVGTQLAAWVRGYLSGANVMQTNKDNLFSQSTQDMDAMENWIARYCLAHPLEQIVVAADQLVKTLAGR